jgi:hypothetical protein
MSKPAVWRFWLYLIEAAHAVECVDFFDLDSRVPESVETFRVLTAQQNQSARRLIEFVREHGDLLLDHIKDPP